MTAHAPTRDPDDKSPRGTVKVVDRAGAYALIQEAGERWRIDCDDGRVVFRPDTYWLARQIMHNLREDGHRR